MDKMKYNGIGIAISEDGPILYFFDSSMLTLRKFLELERTAFITAQIHKYQIFNVHKFNSIGKNIICLN